MFYKYNDEIREICINIDADTVVGEIKDKIDIDINTDNDFIIEYQGQYLTEYKKTLADCGIGQESVVNVQECILLEAYENDYVHEVYLMGFSDMYKFENDLINIPTGHYYCKLFSNLTCSYCGKNMSDQVLKEERKLIDDTKHYKCEYEDRYCTYYHNPEEADD